MPSRKKPSELLAKTSLTNSLREYGFDIARPGLNSLLHRKLSSQVARQCSEQHDPVDVVVRPDAIPSDRTKAIESVYVAVLSDYENQETFDKKAAVVHDKLESDLKRTDDPIKILQWPPYHLRTSDGALVVKREFSGFDVSKFDPLKRFSLLQLNITPEQLAFNDFNEETTLLGYAFEAMVTSHAVHHAKCYRCKSAKSLTWSGGTETSWRDMYCTNCQSCFEIKSKRDMSAIDKAFKWDNFQAGSYRKWCEEDFAGRVLGTDYIVFVSRTPTALGWPVDIAEIGTALPVAVGLSFAEASKDVISVKTRVTLKNRQRWFCVPGGTLPDLKAIFRSSSTLVAGLELRVYLKQFQRRGRV